MRRTSDRIRHAISFEILGLALATPLGAILFDLPLHEVGLVTLVSACLATAWNYLYNILFDRALLKLRNTTRKSGRARIVHAVLFEAGLLVALMPFIAWYLGVSLWEALAMDVSFALFYMVYAFAFNWLYDRLFPLPEWKAHAAAKPVQPHQTRG